MKTVRTFLSLIFAISVGVKGVEFIQRGSNKWILFGIGCLFLALGVSYIAVKSALKNK